MPHQSRQLELVFLNFDNHAFYNEIFDTSSIDPKLWPAKLTVDAILATCAGKNPQLLTRVKAEPVDIPGWKSNCINLTIDDDAVMPDCAGSPDIERELSQMLAEEDANSRAFPPADAVIEGEHVAGAATAGAGAATMDEGGTGGTTVSDDAAGARIGLSAVPVMPSVGWGQEPLPLVGQHTQITLNMWNGREAILNGIRMQHDSDLWKTQTNYFETVKWPRGES